MKVKIGVIGLGFVSQLAHLPSLHYNRKVSIVAICDSNLRLANTIGDKYNINNIFSSYEDMINKIDLDGIILAVNKNNTAEISKFILSKGINLLTEKPSALNSLEASRLTKISKKNKCVYLTGYMKRHDPGIISLEKELRKKNLGRLINVYYEHLSGDSYAFPFEYHVGKTRKEIKKSTLNKNFNSKKNNYLKFLNTHCHSINLLRYFLKKIDFKKSFLNENGEGFINFKSGKINIILNNQYSKSKNWRENIVFYFKQGTIKLDIVKPFLKNVSSKYLIYKFGKNTNLKTNHKPIWCFKKQMDYFISLITNKKKNVNSHDSYKDILLIEKIFKIR